MNRTEVDRIAEQWKREFPDLDIAVFQLLASMDLAYQVVMAEFRALSEDRFGITPGEMRVLYALRRSNKPEGQRPTEIFKYLLISSGAVTKQASRLQQRGLVTVEPEPGNRKSFLIKLTPEGKRIAEEAFLMTVRNYGKVGETLRKMTDAEKKKAQAFLDSVIMSR